MIQTNEPQKPTANQPPYIHLRAADGDKTVGFETEDEDRFYLTVDAAIKACKAFGHWATFQKQFKDLMARVRKWIGDHEADIDEAYLTVRDAGLLFLVVRKSSPFNQPLEDSLTDLDIEIAQDEDFNLIKLSVLALPKASEDSIRSFLAGDHP